MIEDTKNKVPCPICGELFDKRGLNGHMTKHKKENQEPETIPETNEGVNFEFDDLPEETPEEEETDKIECGNCHTEIKEGIATCPGCGGAFEW